MKLAWGHRRRQYVRLLFSLMLAPKEAEASYSETLEKAAGPQCHRLSQSTKTIIF